MWRVIVALIIAVLVGWLGLKFSAWMFQGTVSVIGDIFGLIITALAFWIVYRLLADKVEDHKTEKAHEQALKDAYQAGFEAGRKHPLEGAD